MAKTVFSYRFSTTGAAGAYVADRGVNLAFKARFVVPPSMTNAQANAIVGLAGGIPILPGDPPSICPDGGQSGRKLQFIFEDGGSISLTVALRADLIATAIAIRTVLNGLGGAPVACVKLIGEYFPNLYDELAPAGKVVTPGVSSKPLTGNKQHFYSGVTEYISDGIFGTSYFLPFKIATQIPATPPAEYITALTTAVVLPIAVSPCAGSDPRTSRRYLVQSIVNEGGVTVSQTAEIPVAVNNTAGILNVGQIIATLPSTQCLGYQGESNDRFHKLLP